jgi:hypothetical protein
VPDEDLNQGIFKQLAKRNPFSSIKKQIKILLIMKYFLIALISSLVLLLNISCEKTTENSSYLSKWVGNYEGTSHHWSSYPSGDITDPLIENNSYEKVQVNVQESSKDSCLNFIITFNDSDTVKKNDLQFSVSGVHHSQWGGGSGFGSLDIKFASDTINYNNFQKCGIPCSGGTDFVIARHD